MPPTLYIKNSTPFCFVLKSVTCTDVNGARLDGVLDVKSLSPQEDLTTPFKIQEPGKHQAALILTGSD